MSTFIWHNKNTAESAEELAEKLGASHGVTVPKKFSGELFCLGAPHSAKFKWEDRDITKVYNDPRKIQKFKGREKLAESVGGLGVPVRIYAVKTQDANKKYKIFAYRDNQEMPLPEKAREKLYSIISRLSNKIDTPDLFAADGTLRVASVQHMSPSGEYTLFDVEFIPTNILFAPSITGKYSIINSLEEFLDGNTVEELKGLVETASPQEARALKTLLLKLKGELAAEV